VKLFHRHAVRLDSETERSYELNYSNWRRECAAMGWHPRDVTDSAFCRALIARALLDAEVDGIEELMIEDRRAVAA
jgi:hypothetical protein